MIDIKELRTKGLAIQENLLQRGYHLEIEKIIVLQNKIKDCLLQQERLHALVNKNIHTPQDKERLKRIYTQYQELHAELKHITYQIPNLIHATVPKGHNDKDNLLIKVGPECEEEKRTDYLEKGKNKGLDIEAGVDLAGARFMVLKGKLAKKHRALLNQALDFYGALGYEEMYVPNIVKEEVLFGTGQYPKFKDDMFKLTHNNQPFYLIPTGEVPLTNLVRNKVFKENEVKHKFMTHTPCFRQEVGAAGKDTKGILRQHQFEKVELVRTCLPELGLQNLEEMLEEIEKFINTLGLRYRIIELCAEDLGFAGHKAYDIEVWFNYEKTWREIATITWCHDFQARRMNAKFKRDNQSVKKPGKEYMHTLNGTGLAVGRVLAALIDKDLC